MTEQQESPSTTSQIGGIRAHTNFQAIDATFFNLTDTEGRATAGLMVLLDRMHRPVRAELHFYEEIDGFIRDNTVRQAQLLLQDRYYSREPVVLRIMYVFQDRNTYDVTLPQPGTTSLGPQEKKKTELDAYRSDCRRHRPVGGVGVGNQPHDRRRFRCTDRGATDGSD